MTLRIHDVAPDFYGETTEGSIWFHDWIGNGYVVLFSHPRDFTPVCTTEFIAVSEMLDAFAALGARLIGLSVDPIEEHLGWKRDIEELTGRQLGFPIIADPDLKIARAWDMLPAEFYVRNDDAYLDPVTERLAMVVRSGEDEVRLYANTVTVRSTFIIGPDRRIRMMQTYPNSVGREFGEVLRALAAIQAADRSKLDMPASWRPGEAALVPVTMSGEEARARFGPVTEYLPYFRTVALPR